MSVHAAPVAASTVAVAVDVGKKCVAVSVTDAEGDWLLGLMEATMTAPGVAAAVARIRVARIGTVLAGR